MTQAAATRKHPLLWVPSLYLAMGLPMITVNVVAAIMFKNLGLSNEKIALYTGAMYLPWTIKPLWAPLVEMLRTKRFFVLAMELAMAVSFGLLSVTLSLPTWLAATIAMLWVIGFSSATQDIAGDGIYVSATSGKEQAQYAGIQGIAWNAGRLLASGALVWLTQYLHDDLALDWFKSWTIIMLAIGAFMALAAVWHFFVLPPGQKIDHEATTLQDAFRTMGDAWRSFFAKRGIWMMLVVVFFYRFGEGFIEKMGSLFMLDPRTVGGLGLNNAILGYLGNIFGTGGFLLGTAVGGLVAARWTLKRTFMPIAFALNVPHFTYFYLSHWLPTDLYVIGTVVTIEKIGYGFGSVGLMLYIMQQVSPGKYRTAHYAFATGVMALCMNVTGMVSGYIQKALGHQWFFVFVLAASVPPIVIAWFAPFHVNPDDTKPEAAPQPKADPNLTPAASA